MKRVYFSPELEKDLFVEQEAILASCSQTNLGEGDWGVQDDFI